MSMHSIEVDDEVLAYLKQRAEPFVDTANSVLRRELLATGRGRTAANAARPDDLATVVPPVPAGTPKALAQLLQVAHLVTRMGFDRPQATKLVARSHGVTPQTVNDKYGRQAGFDAVRFDQLLAEPGLVALREHLEARFPRHKQVVDELLGLQNRTTDATRVP